MTWDAATWGFAGVIIGGLTTGLVTLGVEIIRANKASSLDSAKRRDDRQLGRDQSQRQTLLELQAAINELMAAMHLFRHLPAASDVFARWTLQVQALGSRVDDDNVREATEKMVVLGAVLAKPEPWITPDAALDKAGDIATATLARSGQLIRATYLDPSSRPDLPSDPPTAENS